MLELPNPVLSTIFCSYQHAPSMNINVEFCINEDTTSIQVPRKAEGQFLAFVYVYLDWFCLRSFFVGFKSNEQRSEEQTNFFLTSISLFSE